MNQEFTSRQTNRLEPEPVWTILTEAPLKGFAFAREAGTVIAWDEGNHLYAINLRGEHRSITRAPAKVLAACVSDDGSRVVLLGESSHLWFLDADLEVVTDKPGPGDAISMAIDPHGRFVAVSARSGVTQFFSRHGKLAGRFETPQGLAHIAFVPDRPYLLGAADYGMMIGVELASAGSSKIRAEVVWQDRQVSNVGRLTTTGDGGMVLASCFTHGIQRFDYQGHNEGAYHLSGTAIHAVPDFAGRIIAVATLEGELSVLNSAGNVRWKSGVARPVTALATDPLGRYLIYGHSSGEIVRLDLYGSDGSTRAPRPRDPAAARATRPAVNSIRQPEWSMSVAHTEDQAETAVLTVLDDPPRIGVLTNTLKLQIFSLDGKSLGYAPEISGSGRFLRTCPGWIAAATDRQIAAYHAVRNAAQRIELNLVEVTHLSILPDTYGFAVVQERDRIGRSTLAGRWVWKEELTTAVEDLAIGRDAFTAITTVTGRLEIRDPAGLSAGAYTTEPVEPMSLIAAVDGAPPGVAWITLARRAQVLRGHELHGRVLWESPVAWEAWQFQSLGSLALITAPDGRALAYDGAGHLIAQGRASEGVKDLFGLSQAGQPRRVSRQGPNLICSDLDGRVRWRTVCDATLGQIAVGQAGVAALIGRSLAWFPGLD